MNNVYIVPLTEIASFFKKGIDHYTCSLWVGNLAPDIVLLKKLLEKGGGPFFFAGREAEAWEDAMDKTIITYPQYEERKPFPSTIAFPIEDPLEDRYIFDSLFLFTYEHPVLFLLVDNAPLLEKNIEKAVMGYQ